jgi:hypothetical protein
MTDKLPAIASPPTEILRVTVYTAVDTTEDFHRPLPGQHPESFTGEELSQLIAGIDPETAAVEWACRSVPLSIGLGLRAWAFFVEAARRIWVMFDDLPKELADVLLEKNFYELTMRPIQRPFSAEELAALVDEIKQINPATAVVDWNYAESGDPYGLGSVPHLQFGREYFVRASSDRGCGSETYLTISESAFGTRIGVTWRSLQGCPLQGRERGGEEDCRPDRRHSPRASAPTPSKIGIESR